MEHPIAAFTEYDFILCIDRSGSMSYPAKGYASRWEQAKEITAGIAAFAAQVDDDGITVITFGGNNFDPAHDVTDNVKADAVFDVFTKNQPGGSTPLHSALAAAFSKHFSSPKKSIVIVVTDGEPTDPGAVARNIINATKSLKDASEIRILFLQVGDDTLATNYLDGLDNHLQGTDYDIVNAITHGSADGLTVPQLMSRALDDSH